MDDTILRGSVEITIFRGDKILGIKSLKYGGFFGVGGKVEKGETFEQAAYREIEEETGCKAESLQFIAGHTLDPIPGDNQTIRWYCAGFVAEIGEQEPRKCEVHTIPFWTTQEEMIKDSLFPEWYKWWFGLLDQRVINGAKI